MDVIRNRRSVREFTDQEIKQADIDKIIEAGICAPSAMNQQPWEFIVIDDKNILNKLSEKASLLYAKSKVTIVLCARKYDLKSPLRVAQDMSACMQNMMLEATKLGIGSCWIGTYPDPSRMNVLVDVLDIPNNMEPFCGLVLGYPKDKAIFKEVERVAKVHKNRYNA
jgi:nitroreductase